jgi:uncharacterized protein YyaL (SSP411 family)
MTLEFLLRMAVRGLPDALDMVTITLDRMADGGIRDQLGGGFSRYSVDATWHVPHFEKMLYDNAQLAQLYARAWLVTRNDRYLGVATGILDELLRDMRGAHGAFLSSQDADSDGVEGAYFTWSWDELVARVGPDVATVFGATPEGNWSGDGGPRTNVLWRPVPLESVAAELGREPAELAEEVANAERRLLRERGERTRPAVDDKVVTAWNGLAIRAFAEAGRAFGRPGYVDAAESCAEAVWRSLRREDGRLLRSWREGRSSTTGFADDYALLALGFLTLHEATASADWFERAREICDALIDLFLDADGGGFFHTGRDAEALIVRRKEIYDNAVPSGNSAAAEVLLRLSMFTGEGRYEEAAVSALQVVAGVVDRAPTAFGHALSALDLLIGPQREVAIVGDLDELATKALVDQVVRYRYLPNVVLARGASTGAGEAGRIPLLEGRTLVDARPTAYVCEGFTCDLPTTDVEVFGRQLEGL